MMDVEIRTTVEKQLSGNCFFTRLETSPINQRPLREKPLANAMGINGTCRFNRMGENEKMSQTRSLRLDMS